MNHNDRINDSNGEKLKVVLWTSKALTRISSRNGYHHHNHIQKHSSHSKRKVFITIATARMTKIFVQLTIVKLKTVTVMSVQRRRRVF